MVKIFEKNGVKPFVSIKEKFNPELHQAVSHKHHESETGLIIDKYANQSIQHERKVLPHTNWIVQ